MGQYSNDSSFVLDSLPWQEILEMGKSEHFEGKFGNIPEETLKFVLDDSNKPRVIESALKSLIKSDPVNANPEYAEKIADVMREFATRVLRERKTN